MDKTRAEHILGLSGSYDARALKAAFRKLAAANHPDAAEARGGDKDAATVRMQEINEANDYLARLFEDGSERLTCGKDVAAPEEAYNPFNAPSSPHRRPGRRQTTAEYYAGDPRYRAQAYEARRRAAQARQGGVYESLRREPALVEEDPDRPNPGWYGPLRRFLAAFPYRFALLLLVCLAVNLTDPLHVGRTLGPITLEDFLIVAALSNLVYPLFTAPIRAALLWMLDRLRDLAWLVSGMRRG